MRRRLDEMLEAGGAPCGFRTAIQEQAERVQVGSPVDGLAPGFLRGAIAPMVWPSPCAPKAGHAYVSGVRDLDAARREPSVHQTQEPAVLVPPCMRMGEPIRDVGCDRGCDSPVELRVSEHEIVNADRWRVVADDEGARRLDFGTEDPFEAGMG